ncbi:MLO-like protein 9 [Silene latifolia]|uniref:MLO-like protein 9 n=1 Tax=Silene latifolia TaxID=37657 RepID=UPI003D76EB31
MGGGGVGLNQRDLDQTPTWAVAAVCAVIVIISIGLENVLHHIGEYFHKNHKKALYEALEKVKAELMVLGFISLLLTFGQNYIIRMCIPIELANTMLPCHMDRVHSEAPESAAESVPAEAAAAAGHRRLLWYDRRMLSGGGGSEEVCEKGKISLISVNGLHQLHIFIFFLAVFHVMYSCITMLLGRMKIRCWKDWERESINEKGEIDSDAPRFRLTHETSFVRGHTSFWTKSPILFVLGCFFRQFYRAVRRSDYLALRHGFVSVHLAPGSKFDFQKYIKRSLEDDFKVVVGISPLLWASAVFFLLLNVDKWDLMLWLSFLPLVVILAVGTKLEAVITRMAVEITERHAVVQGMPLVQVSDRHFWFSWPQLILYLIHYVLFQNAFEITFFFWIWYEFGLRSCFHQDFNMTILRVALGVGVQFMCCYITLPLYALVTQMGSTMKRSIFDEQTSKALTKWRKNAAKKLHDGKPGPMPVQNLGGKPGSPLDSHEDQFAQSTATIDVHEDEVEPPPPPYDNSSSNNKPDLL